MINWAINRAEIVIRIKKCIYLVVSNVHFLSVGLVLCLALSSVMLCCLFVFVICFSDHCGTHSSNEPFLLFCRQKWLIQRIVSYIYCLYESSNCQILTTSRDPVWSKLIYISDWKRHSRPQSHGLLPFPSSSDGEEREAARIRLSRSSSISAITRNMIFNKKSVLKKKLRCVSDDRCLFFHIFHSKSIYLFLTFSFVVYILWSVTQKFWVTICIEGTRKFVPNNFEKGILTQSPTSLMDPPSHLCPGVMSLKLNPSSAATQLCVCI